MFQVTDNKGCSDCKSSLYERTISFIGEDPVVSDVGFPKKTCF